MRYFRLSADGVSCDANGLKVGGVAPLERVVEGTQVWRLRAKSSIERELTELYGAPVDIERKISGLNVVAEALSRADLARAQVAALLLQFPDPPRLTKAMSDAATADELRLSDLLKDEDFEAEHPRTGTKPNPGWFANKPKKDGDESREDPSKGSWPSSRANRIIRKIFQSFLKRSMKGSPEGGGWVRGAIALADLAAAVWDALNQETPDEDFGQSRNRIDDQLGAASQMPKTLSDLQFEPSDYVTGFEEHHIVEQNPSNLSKNDQALVRPALKFGADVIENPSNIVWIPRLMHELITAKYNSEDPDDPAGRKYRDVVSEMDFYAQREAGLAALREFGALE